MKKIFLILLFASTLPSFAQKSAPTSVVLDKGQKLSVVTTMTQQIDMGMGMEMKNNSNAQNSVSVIDANGKNYTISNTLTGIKISMEFMGQQTDYDSDLKKDSASEIGKTIKNLNIPDTVKIDKFTGSVIPDGKKAEVVKSDSSNPMEGLFESMGEVNADAVVSESFLVIPAGKKVGESWIDSSSTKGQKTTRKFTIKSIDKNIVITTIASTMETNLDTEANGMSITVKMTTKMDTEVISNLETSLVSKRTSKADITGTIELMGQSAPITGSSSTTTIVQ